MIIDTAALGFSPGSSDIQFSGDGQSWSRSNQTPSYSKILRPGNNYIYLYMSSKFFKDMLTKGNYQHLDDALFTFSFTNGVSPESGFYQFTPSTKIKITPKEYGISIISNDGSTSPKESGKIGDENPITFSYKVTTSAPRQADSITARVVGESATLQGVPWCIFTSPDGKSHVPIPAYLSWTSADGGEKTMRNSCSEQAVDMTHANWVQTAWNANVDDGFFFTTTLKLLFPMNDTRSTQTVEGQDWMGTVNANGKVEVIAKWIGVDR